MKIDTQGMSYGTGKGSGKSLEEQRAAIPPAEFTKVNLISDALKEELKQLINEVLDERDLEKKLNGPYDFPELLTYGLITNVFCTKLFRYMVQQEVSGHNGKEREHPY